ncbi:MAG: M15 family metallopeptidase [Acidobacteriota bacterium]|nr:M15 family metallopeptidase [Acidobacteriota bacterium]
MTMGCRNTRNKTLPRVHLTPGIKARTCSFVAWHSVSTLLALAVFLSPGVLFAQAAQPAQSMPADAPAQIKPLIGSYVTAGNIVFEVFESAGQLQIKEGTKPALPLQEDAAGHFHVNAGTTAPTVVSFVHGNNNSVTELLFDGTHARRRNYDADIDKSFHVAPARPLDEIREEALLAEPPRESKNFRKPELVELSSLDPSIHLDIRYATSNNFLGTPVYTQPRAFLQRPAAQALVRALHTLAPLGYGLLIHDGYRPWYVTKIFWEAAPPEGKIFVADPAQGSRHNRGCAVDLTLYDLKTGAPVSMPGTYDEMSPRSFPSYPGGTSLQRWHRDLLRRAMEAEGFSVYEVEWWHFDYKDWPEYPILNIPFEKLDAATDAGPSRASSS